MTITTTGTSADPASPRRSIDHDVSTPERSPYSATPVDPGRCGACRLAHLAQRSPTAHDCVRCEVSVLLDAVQGAAQARDRSERRSMAVATTCMLLAALFWGTAFLFVKIALHGYDPITITFVRCLIGAVVVGSVAAVQIARSRSRSRTTPELMTATAPRRPRMVWQVPAAGFFTALALLGVALGQQYVSSSIAGIVLGTVPVWTAVIIAVSLWLRGATSVWSPALTLALVLGILASLLPMVGASAVATAGGVGILLAASVAHAFSMVTVPGGIARFGPLISTSLVIAVATLTLFPVWLLVGTTPSPTLTSTLALIELGLLPTGLAYIAFFQAVATLGATRAAIAIYLIPGVALVTGAGLAGEALPIGGAIGAACALAAVFVAVRSTRQQAPVTEI